MEHIAAVIVEGKDWAIGIPAVTHVPLFDLTAGGIHPELIILGTGLSQHTLDGR